MTVVTSHRIFRLISILPGSRWLQLVSQRIDLQTLETLCKKRNPSQSTFIGLYFFFVSYLIVVATASMDG